MTYYKSSFLFQNALRFTFIIFILISFIAPGWTQTAAVRVYINGVELPMQAILKGGTAYLPAQTLADALKIKMQWNPVAKQLKVNKTIVPAPTIYKDGALYIPVEALTQTIGATLEWDGAARTIHIKTGNAVITQGGPDTQPIFPVTTTSTQYPLNPETTSTSPVPTYNSNRIPEPETFIPRMAANTEYSVTVTNVNEVRIIKEFYRPKPGYKFIIVHVSQQNISDKVQLYTGRFTLQDHLDQTYEYIEGLSNFWLQILRPGGINFGSLVFELPANAAATKLALHTYGTSPLSLNLH